MDWIQSVILGIVQGVTEFLPVSSSGHLILTRYVLGIPEPGKVFDVLLHTGTLIALIIYFWSDLLKLLGDFILAVKQKKYYGVPETDTVWFMLICTVPGGLLGALFNDYLEGIDNVYLISGLLISFGIILFFADKTGKKEKTLQDLTLKDAVIIGLAQALALFPGVSRSGATMTAGLLLGFDRDTSARFSFLISIPLIGGISGYGILKLILRPDSTPVEIYVLILGVLASVVSGFLCIKFLLDFLKKGSFNGFVIYRVLLGIFLIILALAGIVGK